MNKKIAIFGAGMVAGPIISYLADYGFDLVVVDIDKKRVEKLSGGYRNVTGRVMDMDDQSAVNELVGWCDLAVSLLPAPMHPDIAKKCIQFKKDMVTASYVSPEMQELDRAARDAGIIILNEIGVDPGVDHMSAMKIFDEVREKGGIIHTFLSYCGGLPSHDSNTNPLGYKFSWSPMGVLRAAASQAQYLKDGEEVLVPAKDLFTHYWLVDTGRAGVFEAYPNRNSLEYIDIYKLHDIQSICRGTFRNISHCDTWSVLSKIGFFNDNIKIDRIDCSINDFILTYLLEESVKADIKTLIQTKFNLEESSIILKKMEWLGLFSEEPLNMVSVSPMEVLSSIMLKKMGYNVHERDMLVMHHDIIAQYGQKKQRITSTMFETGEAGGETAMAQTVALPAAIVSRMILEGGISQKGVQRPLDKEIYQPVLKELESLGIKLVEKYYEFGEGL